MEDNAIGTVWVNGHEARIVPHAEGLTVDECWESENAVHTTEWHLLTDDRTHLDIVESTLLRAGTTTEDGLLRLGFAKVDRAPLPNN